MNIVNIKRLNKKATMPNKSHDNDAGFDLYACIDSPINILPGETTKIPTGWAIAVPEGYFGAIYARSGLATKQGLRPANCVGVVDAPYRGECIVAIYNDSNIIQQINPNDRIAQLVITPYYNCVLNEVDELNTTDRGDNGFGSSGK